MYGSNGNVILLIGKRSDLFPRALSEHALILGSLMLSVAEPWSFCTLACPGGCGPSHVWCLRKNGDECGPSKDSEVQGNKNPDRTF